MEKNKGTAPREEAKERNFYQENLALQTSIDIFEANFQELRREILSLQGTEQPQLIQLIREREPLFQMQFRIIRLLHNFLAAAYSLVSHTRNMYRWFWENDAAFPDYQDMINVTFADDPLAQFVEGLREYSQHYRSLESSIVISASSSNSPLEIRIALPLTSLKTYRGWNSKAKKHLSALTNDVDILGIMTSYRDKVVGFHEWFNRRQGEILDALQPIGPTRAREIAEFRKMLVKALEYQLAERLRDSSNPTFSERELFANLLSSNSFRVLETMAPDSAERATRAIQLIENVVVVPDKVKQDIAQLYREKTPTV